ncbi:MAG: SH3 domain-containing protein, partial [Planctomycetota bacterium]
ERRGQGVALIARDRVNVRARPHLGASVVGQLGRGDLLSVRGQEGDWVELAAPSTIPFFVHRDFVRRTGEAPPVGAPRVLLPEPPVERAASAPITEREEAVTAPPVPVAPDAKEMLIEARDRYLAELEKQDLSAMDFGSALGRYEEALEIAEHPVVREAAQAGVRRVQLAIKLQRDHRAQMEALDRALGE